MTRNGKVLLTIGVVVVVGAVAAVGVAATADSSSEKKPLVILADVERRTLEDKATLTGTLAREETSKITAVEDARVSSVEAKDGANVEAGGVFLGLDGRDAVAVAGNIRFFRELSVGDRGEDVRQLKQVLADAGYSPGAIDTVFTEQTRFALAQWQAQYGYPGAAPVTAQSATVSLSGGGGGAAAGGGAYTVGAKSSAGVVIGPGEPARLSAFRTDGPAVSAVPQITIQSAATVVDEGSVVNFVVRASESSGTPLTINLSKSGTASSSDIVIPPTSVILPEDTTSVTVPVQTRADTTIDADKSLGLSVTSGSGYTVGSPNKATTTIVDTNVPEVSISGSTTVTKGGSATLTVTADQAPLSDLQVGLTLAGDAVAGKDYQSVSPTVVLRAGSRTATKTIKTINTPAIQPVRHINATIAQSTNYTISSPSTASVTIAADTALPIVTLSSATTYLTKGQPYVVNLGLSQPLSDPLVVALAYGGNAAAGSDFTPPAGPVTIPAGQTALPVQIDTVTDNTVESDRLLTVAVVPTSLYSVGTPNVSAVVINSQVVPELTISGSTDAIAAGGAATFTITADQAPVEDTTVNYQVVGTAQPGQDFEPLLGTVLLPAGQTSVTVTLRSISKDVIFKPNDMVAGSWPTRVGQVLVKEGESVPPGTPLFTLTAPSFTVTLKASATDRTKLAIGQKCSVKLTGGDKEADGTISELDENVTVDDKTKEQSYEGTIDVADLGAADGASVTIDCVVTERNDAVTVPIAAVKQNGDGEDVVRVIDLSKNGHITETKVKTGLTEGSYIEVTEGLRGDETVVVEVDDEQ